MNLSREETITFIRLVKKNPILWNITRGDYCDKEKKRLAWAKIATYFKQAQGPDAYRKYRNLVSFYAAALAKMKKENKTTSKLFYFHEMHFLRDQIENILHPYTKGKVAFRRSVNMKANKLTESNLDVAALTHPNDEDDDVPDDSDSENPFVPAKPMKQNNLDEQVSTTNLDYLLEHLPGSSSSKLYPNISTTSSEMITQNEYDTFAVHVATQLRQLNTLHAMELMYEIQALITQKRILILNRDAKALNTKNYVAQKKLRKPAKTVSILKNKF